MGSRSALLSSFRLGNLEIRNRIAMAPMTREMCPDGIPGTDVRDYYTRRAAGGVGLILTEGVATDPEGRFGASVPHLYNSAAQNAWKTIVDAAHAEGAAIMAQLWHVGAFSPSLIGMKDSLGADARRLSPSGLAAPGMKLGNAMSEDDIRKTIAGFADAAARAQDAGFDGIEIHGGHGYLPDQFMWSATNHRKDGYGGSAANRARFAAELVEAIRRRAGPDFVIGYRISQWKQLDYKARIAAQPEDLHAVLSPISAAGVDIFHCSTRRFWDSEFDSDYRNLAAWVRALTGKPTITVGSVTLDNDFKAKNGKIAAGTLPGHIAQLEQGITDNCYDLVAIGRSLLANPDWVHRLAAGNLDALIPFEKSMLQELI
ncbi:oxidoreductase [Pacificimonas sp. ICDLI1SI03]